MSELPVFFEQRRVGSLHATSAGPAFTYNPDWLELAGAFPVSLLMPLGADRIGPEIVEPWAANLLPENHQLRSIGRYLGVATADVLGVLAEIGGDTAGALSIGAPGTPSTTDWRPIDGEADLERIIDELPQKPFLVGEEGVSMSLAGVQTKLAVACDPGGRLCIPTYGSPSTHILKPDAVHLPGSVQNEAFCLTLATLCGLLVPEVTTGRAGTRQYFLIARYDRLASAEGWRRLHQEDFCQALGRPPAAKYERGGAGLRGPSLADMFGVVRAHMQAPDILRLLDAAIFNVIACNTDAHAKNYSILLSPGAPRLAPLYDVMCAEVFPRVTRNLAQTIAGEDRGEHLKQRHWRRFAAECGLGAPAMLARVRVIAESMLRHAPAAAARVSAMPAGDPGDALPPCMAAIEGRARAILAGLADIGE